MSWYELPHEPMVAKGHVVAIVEKLEELMALDIWMRLSKEIALHNCVPLSTTTQIMTKKGS